VSGIAIVGFGPGTVIEEPVGAMCPGCGQPVGSGQRGYLLKGHGPTEEAWHRSCSGDRIARQPEIAWAAPRQDQEATLTGHSAVGAGRTLLGT
jgi:hypothetical protein